MVRVFAIAALPLAAAAAPRIELDLAGYQAQAYAPKLTHVGVGCDKDASLCRHVAGIIRPGYVVTKTVKLMNLDGKKCMPTRDISLYKSSRF